MLPYLQTRWGTLVPHIHCCVHVTFLFFIFCSFSCEGGTSSVGCILWSVVLWRWKLLLALRALLPLSTVLQEVKYGVVELSKVHQELRNWDNLFLSGRMHKPVALFFHTLPLFPMHFLPQGHTCVPGVLPTDPSREGKSPTGTRRPLEPRKGYASQVRFLPQALSRDGWPLFSS